MKPGAMPTENNTEEVETYSQYKSKRFQKHNQTIDIILNDIASCSLSPSDKKLLLVEMKQQIEKDILTKF